jgi:hypothetical protein
MVIANAVDGYLKTLVHNVFAHDGNVRLKIIINQKKRLNMFCEKNECGFVFMRSEHQPKRPKNNVCHG